MRDHIRGPAGGQQVGIGPTRTVRGGIQSLHAAASIRSGEGKKTRQETRTCERHHQKVGGTGRHASRFHRPGQGNYFLWRVVPSPPPASTSRLPFPPPHT